VCYPQNPVRSIAELYEAVGIMRAALPEIRVPVLLVSSRDDSSFVVSGMDAIYEALGTSDKQKVWIEGSGHNIVEEPKREFVFKTAADFIERVSQA
jgi:esterase/lipase